MPSVRDRVAGLFDNPRFSRFLYCLLFITLIWNSRSYEYGDGFDFGGQRNYVEYLYENKSLPTDLLTIQVAYNPPAFYIFAAGIKWIADGFHTNEFKLAKLILAFLSFATVWMGAQMAAWMLGSRGRPAFLLFIGSMTTWFKSTAMFSPELFNAFLIWSGYFLAARSCERHSTVRPGTAIGAGLAGAVAILTRPLSLGVVPGWIPFFSAAIWRDRGNRRAWIFAALILVGIGSLGAGASLVLSNQRWGRWFKGPTKPGGTKSVKRYEIDLPKEDWRATYFYYSIAPKVLFTAPMRQNLGRRLLPILYSEWWGDYWKYWTLNQKTDPINETLRLRLLAIQNALAVIPTAMIAAGFFALLCSSVRAKSGTPASMFLAPAAMTLICFVVFARFAGKVTLRNVDAVKAHYLCFLVPAAALGGAKALVWALERARGARFWLVAYCLAFFLWSHLVFCFYVRP